MEIRSEIHGAAARLVLSGRLDASWADHLVESVEREVRAGRHAVELDLGGIEFLSSAGIRALLRSQRQVAAVRGTFALLAPRDLVRATLKTAGLLVLVKDGAANATERAPSARQLSYKGPSCDWSGAWRPDAPAAHVAALGETGSPGAPALRTLCGRDEVHVGIGALGDDGDPAARAGEFLAAAGFAAALPTDGARLPDYVAAPDAGRATASLVHALRAQGFEPQPLRFDSRETRGTPLSEALSSLLDIAGSDAVVCVLLAECAELSGASLLKSPRHAGDDPAGWPQARDNYACTTERAGDERTTLVAAFAAHPGTTGAARLAAQLRPHGTRPVAAHAHALVFPYRPLPRIQGALRAAIDEQLAAGQPLGLMHLLHDDREDGLGETMLLRGTAWLARATTEAAT